MGKYYIIFVEDDKRNLVSQTSHLKYMEEE